MATVALSPAQALRAQRRLDQRVLVGLLLMIVAAAGGFAFWRVSTDTQAVLETTRDLPAGARITTADLAVAHVRLDPLLYQASVPSVEEAGVVGRQVTQPVGAHQLLARTHLSSHAGLAPDQVAMTVPVSAEAAVGGRLRPGDSVAVLATLARGHPESRTVVVLPRVTVYAVNVDDRQVAVNTSAAAATDGDQADRRPGARLASVTLLLTNQEQMLQLAQARWNGDLDLVLLPPEA